MEIDAVTPGDFMVNGAPPDSRGPGGIVLIVDDQQAIAELLINVLSSEGFEAIRADSATSAAALARALKPNLILLDVIMPERSGWDVLVELRADPSTRETPVIIISALYDRPGLHPLPAGGPIRFAAKPFDIAELLRTATELLTR